MAENDIVELIIAVDLDPTDPEQPINVNDVKVRGEGEEGTEGGADYRGLLVRVLEANDIPAGDMDDTELTEAAEQFISGDEMAEDTEEDMFSRAMGMPAGGPGEGAGPMFGPEEDEEEE